VSRASRDQFGRVGWEVEGVHSAADLDHHRDIRFYPGKSTCIDKHLCGDCGIASHDRFRGSEHQIEGDPAITGPCLDTGTRVIEIGSDGCVIDEPDGTIGEAYCVLSASRQERLARCCREPAVCHAVVGREVSGTLQRCRGSRMTAPVPSPLRRALKLVSHIVVGANRGRGKMPNTSVRLAIAECGSDCPMRRLTPAERCSLVEGSSPVGSHVGNAHDLEIPVPRLLGALRHTNLHTALAVLAPTSDLGSP
jgi:hypothetical protein